MNAFTKSKTETINLYYVSAASVFAIMAAYSVWKRGALPDMSWWGFLIPVVIALIFAAFPIYWYFRPSAHPVRRAIASHGNPDVIGPALDCEMELSHEVLGPFHFTKSYLVYEPGYTLNVVPYAAIVGAEVVVGSATDAAKIVATTRDGKTYDWHNTLIQGYFHPNQVLARIQSAARLEPRPKHPLTR